MFLMYSFLLVVKELVFFSPSNKGSFSLANVVPGARCSWNFIDDIALVVFGRSKLRDREMLL